MYYKSEKQQANKETSRKHSTVRDIIYETSTSWFHFWISLQLLAKKSYSTDFAC